MTEYQLDVIRFGSIAPLIPLAASAVMWFRDKPEPIWRRFVATSHGLWFALAFAYAVAVCPLSEGYGYGEKNPYEIPFLTLLGLGLLSTVASVPLFRGSKLLLLVHLLALPSAGYAFLIGAMAISHDWM